MVESASEPVMQFIYRILSDKDGRIVVAALSKQFIDPVCVVPQDVVVVLKVKNIISEWLSSGKLMAPKIDNIQS